MYRMVRWDVSPRELLSLANAWFPWRKCDKTGEYLIHVSSAFFVLKHKWFAGFGDETTKRLVLGFVREARRTFTDKLKRLKPYDWEGHFTGEVDRREYQFAAMERIYRRITRHTTGVLLGDDVGMGKTLTALGVLQRMRQEGYFGRIPGVPLSVASTNGIAIVLTTSSCRSQWGDEIEKFCKPRPRTVVVQGGSHERRERMSRDADVYILNHEMVRLPQYAEQIEALFNRARVLVVDETGKIKNPDSATTQCLRKLSRHIPHRIAFNATPIENGLHDLFAVFDLLDSGVLGGREGFEGRYVKRNQWGKVIGYSNLKELKLRCAVCYLRRNAEECGEQMPPVVASYRPVEMGKKQEAAYLAAAGEYVRDDSKGAVAFSKLAKVQYAALAAYIKDYSSESAKLDDLEGLLDGELAGERVVVFSRFTTVARFAYARLSRFRPLLICGDTPQHERDTARRRFESHDGVGRVLICTEAGDRGLNLQAAGVVVNLDLPWNAARLRQRVGRVRRIGQKRKSVLVINPIARFSDRPTRPTADDWFAKQMISPKREVSDAMFGDDGIDELGVDRIDMDAIREYVRSGL